MPRTNIWIAASCILLLVGLFRVISSGASPASKEKVLYSLTGGLDGANPYSDLVMDAAGNLYGTTSGGGSGKCGSGSCGTVFELARTKDGWKEKVLYDFTGFPNDGESPQAGLTFDSAGNLYGTTTTGGSFYGGTVFKLSPNSHGSWTETVICNFTGGSDGAYPAANLVFDGQGNMYGTASQGGWEKCQDNGGGRGCGTVFELTPQADGSWTESTVHVFARGNYSDGAVPSSGVALDSAGNLYGMTFLGGAGPCLFGGFTLGIPGCGTIYELTRASGGGWTETILYNFVRGGGSGTYPSGGVLFDKAGDLYGTSQAGGDGYGTFFELRTSPKNGWQQSDPHFFYGNPDGRGPVGLPVVDAEGTAFGVTSSGGVETGCYRGCGTVFELKRSKHAWKERILHSFGGAGDGATPQAGLLLDSNGHLYGTTSAGGTGTACNGGCGTVYEITP